MVYDAIIFGGGFRGFGAALPLLGDGRRILIVEPRPSLGWEATLCFNLELARGVSKSADALASEISRAGGMKGSRIDPAIAELKILKLIEGAGILHYCHAAGLLCENGRLKALLLAGKSGLFAVQAKAVIDASCDYSLFSHVPGAKIAPPQSDDSVFSFALEATEENPSCPAALGGDVLLRGSAWGRERHVEFKSKGLYEGRLAVPEVLRAVKGGVKSLEDSLLTRSAFAGLRLGACALASEGEVPEGLFRVEPEGSFAFDEREALLSKRMLMGEMVGIEVSKALGSLPFPGPLREAVSAPVNSVEDACDTLVCGGGTAGALAAIAAARRGCKTLVWEASASLGGIGAGGGIHYYYYGVKGGLQDELDARMDDLSPLFLGGNAVMGFHPEVKKTVLEQMLREAGGTVEYETALCGAETKPLPDSRPAKNGARALREVVSAIGASFSGQVRRKAAVFIDATGDADLAAFAGCRHSIGRETDSIAHTYSQVASYLLEGSLAESHEWFKRGMKRGAAAPVSKMLGHHNFDAGYCDSVDVWDLSRARVDGIRQYDRDSFSEEDRVVCFAPILGIRASRQIFGDCRLKLADQVRGSEFPDVIGYAYSHYDNHASDYENESDEALVWAWTLDSYNALMGCEIPYRAMLPEGLEGLLVACRALSVDYDGHHQLRMQRDMQRVGEAAGAAAALACEAGLSPRWIDVGKLQRELAKSGALLSSEKGFHSDAWKPGGFYPSSKPYELVSGDGGTPSGGALTRIVRGKEELLKSLGSASQEERCSAALALASAGCRDSLGVLIECVKERSPFCLGKSCSGRNAPVWKIAVAMLGILRSKEAISAIEELLKDPVSDQAALILAVRALGMIGEASSAQAIQDLLKRPGLPSVQEFSKPVGDKASFKDGSLWKLELAAARSLARLGVPRRDLIEKNLKDKRAYVRRAASLLN